MFGPLGIWEILFILGIALLIFGPKKLPEIGKTLGRSLGEFRRATTDLKRSIETEIEQEDRKAARPQPARLPETGSQTESASTTASAPETVAATEPQPDATISAPETVAVTEPQPEAAATSDS